MFFFLEKKEKRQAFVVSLGLILSSVLDAVAILGVMPLISLIVEPNIINTNVYLSTIYEFLGDDNKTSFIESLALGAVFLMLVSMTSILFIQNKVRVYAVNTQNRLSKTLVNKLIAYDYSWFLDKNSTECAHHIYTDVLMWMNDGVLRALNMVGHVSLIFICSIIVVTVSPYEGLVALFFAALCAYLLIKSVKKPVSKLSEIRRETSAKSILSASQIFSGIKDIKLMKRESHFIDCYMKPFSTYGMAGAKLRLIQSIPPYVIIFLGQMALIIYVVLLWKSGKSSGEIAAQMALIVLISSRVVPTVNKLIAEINAMWAVVPHLKSLENNFNEFDEILPSQKQKSEHVFISRTWRKLALESLSYKYADKEQYALSNVSLSMKRGLSYGIAGPSGAGKTTLLDIMLGLLPPVKGSIQVDDISLNEDVVSDWYNMIGYVPQAPFILDQTLRENVAFGVSDDEICDSKVIECIEKANLSEFVLNNKLGLNTLLGDKGIMISGGERQRICIARALYKEPEILILDEATSALDPINEKAIKDSISNLRGEITIIMIAHRLTTIEDCDEIFLFEKGRLVANDSYTNLVENVQLFKDMTINIK